MSDMTDVPQANPAKPQKPQEPAAHPRAPQKFWQWLFLYPAFGLALLSAVPEWVNSVRGFWMELQGRPLEQALEQQRIFTANLDCMRAPYVWHRTGTGLEVDATMCPRTADLLLRFNRPDGQFMYGIDIDAITQREASAGSWLISAAYAQEVTPEPAADLRDILLAQSSETVAIVQCVDQIDDRTIMRHVKVGPTCFDERLDTLTGQITAQTPTPCRSTC